MQIYKIKNLYDNILTVKIIKEPVLTVSSYARGQLLNSQDLVDDEISLTIDKANYFSFKVDDIEEKQSHVNWQDLATSSAAYKLKDTYDAEVLTYIKDTVLSANTYGSTGTPRDVGHTATDDTTPLELMNNLSRRLDVLNVPTDSRWYVAGPYFWEQMQDENSKLVGVDFTGDSSSILRNGQVIKGMIRNFKCYTSNNMPDFSSTVFPVLAGHMSAIATASQIAKTEVLRDNDSFADIVRGLHMYGRKMLRTDAVVLAWYKTD